MTIFETLNFCIIGLHFRVRGPVLCIGFLDQNGSLLLSPADSWKDSGKEAVRNRGKCFYFFEGTIIILVAFQL